MPSDYYRPGQSSLAKRARRGYGQPMKEVVIYSTSSCLYCRQAEALLERKGVPYKSVDVTEDPAMRAKLVELTGQRTVPQIFIGGESVGGYSDLVKLQQQGQLDVKLA